MSQRTPSPQGTMSISEFISFLFKTPLADVVLPLPPSNNPEAEAELNLQNQGGMMLKTFRSSYTPVEDPAYTITNDETEYWGESAHTGHGTMSESPMGSSLNRSRFSGARQRASFETSTHSPTPSSPSSMYAGVGWMNHQTPYGTHSRNTSMVGSVVVIVPLAYYFVGRSATRHGDNIANDASKVPVSQKTSGGLTTEDVRENIQQATSGDSKTGYKPQASSAAQRSRTSGDLSADDVSDSINRSLQADAPKTAYKAEEEKAKRK
ncbi:hypothetical protein FRC17_001630 [Serendipita sp. 399]|nr:hypothetical protein FRC17_001630 [Serendipita sp. 399]